MSSPLRWESQPLGGLVLAYNADGLLVGRVRKRMPNAWAAWYDPAGLERAPRAPFGRPPDEDARFLVAEGVGLAEARRAVERRHEAQAGG